MLKLCLLLSQIALINCAKNPAGCQNKCSTNEPNVMCEKNFCSFNNRCGRLVRNLRFSAIEIYETLRFHNSIRQKLVMGKTNLSKETLSNVNALSWNSELAYLAKCKTNECKYDRTYCLVSKTLPDLNHYGVNHEWVKDVEFHSLRNVDMDFLRKMLLKWHKQEKYVEETIISNYANPTSKGFIADWAAMV